MRSNLARNIRYARVMLNWSQEALAANASLHRNLIGMIERKESAITLDTLSDLAKALGVDPWVLLQPPSVAQPQILKLLDSSAKQ
ncbi:MAG: helix-turn-helix transcriptional regulator [Pseudomonadota bacterium]